MVEFRMHEGHWGIALMRPDVPPKVKRPADVLRAHISLAKERERHRARKYQSKYGPVSPIPPDHFIVGDQAGLDPLRGIDTETNCKDA